MRHRFVPRRAGGPAGAIGRLIGELQPASLLAEVQRVWPAAVGAALAAHATPTAARDGVVSVTCESAVWAHELTLMAGELIAGLDAELGAGTVIELRCSAAVGRSWARPV
ncbi:MAG: DciA family protein [Actinomycetota bacterium]|nr:DciA family protein [Actinomycetota bacterium]